MIILKLGIEIMAKKKEMPQAESEAVADDNEIPGRPITIKAQYLKDLSFENPNAPHILAQSGQPEIALSVNIDANNLNDNRYTVTLSIKCESKIANHPQFVAELMYEALVELHESLDEKYHQPILMVEAPRFIFPFIRNVLADITREGGFPPLFLQPIDFGALYRDKLEKTISDTSDNMTQN